MSHGGFGIYLGFYKEVCSICTNHGFEALADNRAINGYIQFPTNVAPSHILQLGDAMTALTGVASDFGNHQDRCEAEPLVFVDLLDPTWVSAVGALNITGSDVQALWTSECLKQEGETPSWAKEDHSRLIESFLRLCEQAATTRKQVIMVWQL